MPKSRRNCTLGGEKVPYFVDLSQYMIEKKQIIDIVKDEITDTDLFLVEVNVSATNAITVMIDSMQGVPISKCIDLSRAIEKHFDRDVEDFELSVMSAGIGQPFIVIEQYHKNIGRQVEVLTCEGKKYIGKLIDVKDTDITLEIEEKVNVEGKKKKQTVFNTYQFAFDTIKYTKDIITF